MMSLANHPDSWSEIALGEINQYRSKNVQPKDFPEESFELWSVPIFPTGEPETLLGTEIGSSKQSVESRDVLICKINPRINRVWEVGQKSSYRQIASSEWIVVRQPLLEPRYLLRFFQSDQFRTKLCADVTGVGGSLTRAQPKKVATFPVVVPPSAEQKAIADKLDTLLAQVENTKARLERIPQILKRFRQSVLAAAVSGRLTEEWREVHLTNCTLEEFLKQLETLRQTAIQEENLRTGRKSKYKAVNIDTSDAPAELPESWNWIPVEALATKVTDGVHKKPTYVSSGVPFITVKNLTKGSGISFSETNFISEKDHEEFCKRTNPEMGDILISKDGTLGVVRQIRTNRIFSIFVSVALVKPADRRMSDYLEIAFQSPVVQGQMIGVGTGLQHRACKPNCVTAHD